MRMTATSTRSISVRPLLADRADDTALRPRIVGGQLVIRGRAAPIAVRTVAEAESLATMMDAATATSAAVD